MAEVVRELWRSQSPTPCGQGQLEPAAQRCVQLGVSICKDGVSTTSLGTCASVWLPS